MAKPKSFRTWNPEQTLLLPPSPVDSLPQNDLVFFLVDLAGELELEAIHAVYRQKDLHGEKAYDPRMMVVLLLYAYCVGLPSSRKIEKDWTDKGGHVSRLPGGDRKPAARPQPDLRLPPPAPRCPGRVVRSGAEALSEGWAGEPGPGGTRRHQGERQCQQAQGHDTTSGCSDPSGSWRARCMPCCARPS